jgi:hypothetical protein
MNAVPRYTVFWLCALDQDRVPRPAEPAVEEFVQLLERSEGDNAPRRLLGDRFPS